MKIEKKSDKKLDLSDSEKKALVKAQQRKMDDMALYTNLVLQVKSKTQKDLLRLIADEEGKHASILKTYTGEVLKPKAFRSVATLLLIKVLGLSRVAKMLSKDELKSAKSFEPFLEKFKKVKEIISDDKKHADRILKLCE